MAMSFYKLINAKWINMTSYHDELENERKLKLINENVWIVSSSFGVTFAEWTVFFFFGKMMNNIAQQTFGGEA